MRAYVIGPVTGIEEGNRPAFEAARAEIRTEGLEVTVPHDLIPADASHERAMRMSIGWMLREADVVAVLPGWESSDGASLEYAVAAACGIPTRMLEGGTGNGTE